VAEDAERWGRCGGVETEADDGGDEDPNGGSAAELSWCRCRWGREEENVVEARDVGGDLGGVLIVSCSFLQAAGGDRGYRQMPVLDVCCYHRALLLLLLLAVVVVADAGSAWFGWGGVVRVLFRFDAHSSQLVVTSASTDVCDINTLVSRVNLRLRRWPRRIFGNS